MDAHRLDAADAPCAASSHVDRTDFDSEIGILMSVAARGEGDDHFGFAQVGALVVCEHRGCYEGIADGYQVLDAWMKDQVLSSQRPSYEYDLNDPQKRLQMSC